MWLSSDEIYYWPGQRTPKEVYRFEKYNRIYPGIVEGLARVKDGMQLFEF